MELHELPGVGPVLEERLGAAGFVTVADIAGADPDALSAVPGIGPSTAPRLIAAARRAVAPSRVAKAIDRLRRAVPDLAKSKKHAAALEASTDRMAASLDGLDQRKVRKRVTAEAKRVSSEARKRAVSNRAAKSLQGYAGKIEKAVRSIDA